MPPPPISPSPTFLSQPIYSALLKITRPGPLTSLHRSRAILRFLQTRFGQVAFFLEGRHLPKTPASDTYIFTIFGSRSAYEKALASSPLVIRVEEEEAAAEENSDSSPSATTTTTTTNIHVQVSPSTHYNHQRSIAANPFHGPYDIHKASPTYQTLRAVGTPQPAIADMQLRGRDVFFARRKAMLLRNVAIDGASAAGTGAGRGREGAGPGEKVGRGERVKGGGVGGGLMGLWRESMAEADARKKGGIASRD